MRRTTCRGCGGNKLEELINFGNMPLAGGFLPNAGAVKEEKLYPLPVHICLDCGLIQIFEVIPQNILFKNYSFSSSTIRPLIQHFENYAKWLKEKLNPNFVVEFGCNDGVLLGPLKHLGIKACGVDISENITAISRAQGLDVVTGFFDESIAADIRQRLGAADVVTGSNAFPHNDHPEDILKAAKKMLHPEGYICLEVMYLDDLLEQLQWDTLYHEHLTFYCLKTLNILLNRYGFKVVDAERLPIHGGSLRVSATLNQSVPMQLGAKEIFKYEEEKGLTSYDIWKNFRNCINKKIDVVSKTLMNLSKTSRIWGYGAAGKATMWVNACKMNYLEAMVDASPLRAGKLMPGTHTPIVFPDELKKNPPDYIFVTAWNYAEQIKAKESWFKGVWITPLPELKFF